METETHVQGNAPISKFKIDLIVWKRNFQKEMKKD